MLMLIGERESYGCELVERLALGVEAATGLVHPLLTRFERSAVSVSIRR